MAEGNFVGSKKVTSFEGDRRKNTAKDYWIVDVELEPGRRFGLRLAIFEEPCRPAYRNGFVVNRARYCQYIDGKGDRIGKRQNREIVACEIELSIVAP